MRTTFTRALLRIALAAGVLFWTLPGTAKELEKDAQGRAPSSLAKVLGTPDMTMININNISGWIRADGQSAHNPSLQSGVYYPRGTAAVIYQDGLVWGGKAYLDAAHTQAAPNQVVRVGGQTYNVSTIAGRIIGTGATAVRSNVNDADVRVYRIRRDYFEMDETSAKRDAGELYHGGVTNDATAADIEKIKAQYAKDWTEWPVQYGAPYVERNGTPGYQPPPAFSKDADGKVVFGAAELISGNYDEPGIAGADPSSPAGQVVWTVCNDLDQTTSNGLYGSDPSGFEVQITLWGYKRSDALGNLYFKKFRFINKGGVTTGPGATGSFFFDSVFVAQWSDPDMGGSGDDLTGCDTSKSLGFVYNGQAVDADFKQFNLPPPAVGYDFLQGPVVAGTSTDYAVFDLRRVNGKKNLPMTSFAWFAAGSTISDPPQRQYEGTLQWWRMLQGYVPEASTKAWRRYPVPPGFPNTPYPLAGDPVTGQGAIDGLSTDYSFQPGDRRLSLQSGPFQFAPGDTQEVVVGVVAGIGADRKSSITVLKFNDEIAQNTYDALFAVPSPPSPPDVKIAELDGEVIFEWGSNAARVADTEKKINQPGNFAFEGYVVYQLPSAGSSLADGKRVATFDLPTDPAVILDRQIDASGQVLQKPVQFGSNSGIKRQFVLNRDYVKDVNKLNNGSPYYLAVTAYSFSQTGYTPASLESPPIVYTVVPQQPMPGVRYAASFGDTLAGVTHTAGTSSVSDGNLIAEVVNPKALTGGTYSVRFGLLGTAPVWHLLRTQAGRTDTVAKNQTDQTGSDLGSPMVDGIRFRVFGASNDFKNFLTVSNGAGPINPPQQGAFAFNSSGFPLTPTGADRPDGTIQQSGGALTASRGWGIHTGMNSPTMSLDYAFFTSRVTQSGARWSSIIPYDFEMRFTAAGGKALCAAAFGSVADRLIDVPFELWNIGIGTPTNTADDYRMFPNILDVDGSNSFNLLTQAGVDSLDNGGGGAQHAISGGGNDPFTDWIYWVQPTDKSPGQAGYNAIVAGVEAAITAGNDAYLGAGTNNDVLRRMVLVGWNFGTVTSGSYAQLMPQTGTTFRIITTKPNSVNDVFTVVAPANTFDLAAAKVDAGNVGVFPNPYYAFNPNEISRLVKFVTFNRLPAKAKLRIFNLAGQLVRTMDKDDPTQFITWDLNNQDNFPVASGMYIVHVDMPTLGATKILKVAIIQEQEVPRVF